MQYRSQSSSASLRWCHGKTNVAILADRGGKHSGQTPSSIVIKAARHFGVQMHVAARSLHYSSNVNHAGCRRLDEYLEPLLLPVSAHKVYFRNLVQVMSLFRQTRPAWGPSNNLTQTLPRIKGRKKGQVGLV
ncbi:hypothetical protein VFPPC_18671 [Pochonia chlamydosporia 170]|uniref:Uncharacterized protein n=1 Tax=Pochonia chlamydosporia 170 TaxID=1380566 RepID=A0A219ASJ2_METCM|nr:hypothetical protein VFPPC_18671 [Pochonia chlamydosporia 170]OWT43602.1 hypothetical protein VFPPC_18671 [Pochonia chlamydosporia 170]